MRHLISSCLALSAVLVAGCGGSNSSGNQTTTTRLVTSTGQNGDLRYSLSMKDSFAPDEMVTATYTVENTGRQSLFYDSYRKEALVEIRKGEELLTLPYFHAGGQDFYLKEYKPGRKYNFSVTWGQHIEPTAGQIIQVGPGQYSLGIEKPTISIATPDPNDVTGHIMRYEPYVPDQPMTPLEPIPFTIRSN